jgi:hypothetical protein
MSDSVKFQAKVQSDDRGHVRLVLPFEPSEKWGKKTRHYVKGSVNGVPFQGSIGSKDGKYFFPLTKELRKSAGIGDSSTVKVEIYPDLPQEGALPDDFLKALSSDKKAMEFFGSLSGFYRNTFVKKIVEAKKAETRVERIKKIVAALKAGKKQI